MRRLTIMLLMLGLAACTQVKLVKPERQTIGGAYSVQSSIAWNAIDHGEAVIWTNNGLSLEMIRLYGALEEGESLFPKARGRPEFPTFDSDMRASEVQEFIVDSLVAANYGDVRAANLAPAQFGDLAGYRFDLSMLSDEGLQLDGLAVGAVQDGKLNLILYFGPRSYYFPKYKDEVEAIISSITVKA